MIDPTDTKTLDLVATQQAQQQMQQVVATYGDNLPYNYERVLNECAFFIEQSATAALELGKRLILIKEMEGHGNFRNALERLGLSIGTAHNVMKVATKLSNVQTSEHLLHAVKSRSKVFEMMILDNDDLKELTEGGTVAGIKLDDIDRMSVRELRTALREAKELSATKDKQLQAKNQKLDEMEGKLDNLSRKLTETNAVKKLELPSPDKEAEQLRTQVSILVANIDTDGLALRLTKAFTDLQAHTHKTGIDHTAFMTGCINQILRTAKQVQSDFGLYADDASDNAAWWETESAAKAADEAIAALDIDWMDVADKDKSHGETQH